MSKDNPNPLQTANRQSLAWEMAFVAARLSKWKAEKAAAYADKVVEELRIEQGWEIERLGDDG